MKIFTVVGARPQFIKTALLSLKLRVKHREYLVHTGQHYDSLMSDLFFKELNIPMPDENLEVGSGSHAVQTASMLVGLERSMLSIKPDLVLVYGDTNSTLAAALASAKLNIPIAHVEAGLRSYNTDMPEEINRIVSDKISKIRFCPCERAAKNLQKEGITDGVEVVGDVMYDLFKAWQAGRFSYKIKEKWEEGYWLMTLHRAGNTINPYAIKPLLKAFEDLKKPIYWPIHPRSWKFLKFHSLRLPSNLHLIDPLGYPEMMIRLKTAEGVLTDSGGLQKEAFWLGVPCLTLRDETEWTETIDAGANRLVGLKPELVIDGMMNKPVMKSNVSQPYGDGDACSRIVEAIDRL